MKDLLQKNCLSILCSPWQTDEGVSRLMVLIIAWRDCPFKFSQVASLGPWTRLSIWQLKTQLPALSLATRAWERNLQWKCSSHWSYLCQGTNIWSQRILNCMWNGSYQSVYKAIYKQFYAVEVFSPFTRDKSLITLWSAIFLHILQKKVAVMF